MDSPEPPTIVFEQPAPCADVQRADEALRRSLASSVAPGPAWTIRARVTPKNGGLVADGEITDSVGADIAHRTIDGDTKECRGLLGALGVWASLVLDREAQRPPEVSVPPAIALPKSETDTAPAKPPAAERMPLESPRAFEIGAGGSYSYGQLGPLASIVGGHVFAMLEGGGGWMWRTEIAGGHSLRDVSTNGDVDATWSALRLDACRRIPGNYAPKKGLQLDACGGLEVGVLIFQQGAPKGLPQPDALGLFAPGGVLALRGDLSDALSADARGIVGVNLVRGVITERSDHSEVTPLFGYARLELGLSWSVR